MSYNQYVLFNLDQQEFAIDISCVKTIEKLTALTRVPCAQEYVEGVINLRGEVVPVIDTRKRLGFNSKEADGKTRIIILKVDDTDIGMIVDSASEVVYIEHDNIDDTVEYSKEVKESFVSGVARMGERIAVILDIKRLLNVDKSENRLPTA